MPRVLVTPVYLQGVEGRHSAILRQAGFEICFPDAEADLRQAHLLIRQLAGIDAMLANTGSTRQPSRLSAQSERPKNCCERFSGLNAAIEHRVPVVLAGLGDTVSGVGVVQTVRRRSSR